MKIVINGCFGGFSLSPLAVQEIAKRKGKDCYFFDCSIYSDTYTPISIEDANKTYFWSAYSVPNPQDYRLTERDSDGLYTSANKRSEQISLDSRPDDRTDPILIEVVEQLGEKANGRHAQLKVIEIPDGVSYEISEYDGMEKVEESHASWS